MRRAPATPGYGRDLAYIHDVGFGGFAERAAPFLLQVLRAAGIRSGLVVDLGCGSGQWPRALLDAGYEVLGIDLSPPMLARARRRAPRAAFLRASLFDAPLPRCDAVTCLGEGLSYRFDAWGGTARVGRLFRRVSQALRPGGLFVFDVLERTGRAGGPATKFREGAGWAVLVRVERDRRRPRIARRITSLRKVGRLYRRTEEVHRLERFDRGELLRSLRRAGFRVRILRGHGELRFAPGHVGLLARKEGGDPGP